MPRERSFGNEVTDPKGKAHTQYLVAVTIFKHPGTTVSQLLDYIDVEHEILFPPSTIHQVIKRLQKSGLIESLGEGSKFDPKKHHITELGEKYLEDIQNK